MNRHLVLALLLPLLLGTSCRLAVSFFIANLSPRPVHVEYSVPCTPDCPTPTIIAVQTLKRGGQPGDILSDRPAPASVQGRVDALVTYSVDVPPDTAIRIFGGATGFDGNVRDFEDQFPTVRITVDTGQSAHSYEGRALGDSFHKWHKLVHVLEVR